MLQTLYSWFLSVLQFLLGFAPSWIADSFRPQGYVTFILREKGVIIRQWSVGHNIVMSWQSENGEAPTSGRDIIRRVLVPASFAGSLAADAEAVIYSCQLGSGTTAETTADTGLETEISGSEKPFTEVEFDPAHPYVTFIARYDESEVNQTISEVLILTARGDAFARKTCGAFTKNSSWALEVRYQLRIA